MDVFDPATLQLRRVGAGGSHLEVDFLNPAKEEMKGNILKMGDLPQKGESDFGLTNLLGQTTYRV